MRLSVAMAAVCLVVVGLANADDVRAAIRKPTHIPPEALVPALKQLAHERGFQLVFQTEVVGTAQTHGANGDLSVAEALTQLLEGTNLVFDYVDDKTITIRSTSQSTSMTLEPGAPGTPSTDPPKESRRIGGGSMLLAQAVGGQDQGNASVEKPQEQEAKKKPAVEEVVVTGSRIPTTAKEASQEVNVYSREQIDRSGQTTVSDFLNTLPDVSISLSDSGLQTYGGVTAVQLHGLPVGTTLLLINGRRVEDSGLGFFTGFAVFDLNSIPVSAVERIEVLSEGSSAVYGSDAIAGVVNIILRKDFDGFEVNAKYGGASGTDEWDGDAALGKTWDKGSLSIVANYQSRSELVGSQRKLTADQDYRPFGGIDARSPNCNPGNVFTLDGTNLPGTGAPFAAVPSGFSGPPSQSEFASTAGMLNECSLSSYTSFIPATRRLGLIGEANYRLSSSVAAFSELMYSHVEEFFNRQPPTLSGTPQFGFSSFTVPASNPFNPFGEPVGISDLLSGVGISQQNFATTTWRVLVGLRGNISDDWSWEIAGWGARDRTSETDPNQPNNATVQAALDSNNPANALNPFVSGAQASTQVLQSLLFTQFATYEGKTTAVSGFIQGPLVELPSGAIKVVLGAEFDRDTLFQDQINNPFYPPNTSFTFSRKTHAIFAEAKAPIIAGRSDANAGDTLAVTAAARYDYYDTFGHKVTPQFGVEWRPTNTLLLRGTYSQAFLAPNLIQLYAPPITFQEQVVDPRNGNQIETVTVNCCGGNVNLNPETAHSSTLGFVYSSTAVPNLRLSITHWDIEEDNNIGNPGVQGLVNNEDLFPGSVVRNPAGIIIQVNDTNYNFGHISARGLDYRLSYKVESVLGEFQPSVSATETYHYLSALTPDVAPTNRVSQANDDGSWAPRWKSTVALRWDFGSYSANVGGRYVGSYQDYDSTRRIGNFWLLDANFRFAIGRSIRANDPLWSGAYIQIAGVNLSNKLPQYSNYQFGSVGYDPAEADIRGRFLYIQLGAKW